MTIARRIQEARECGDLPGSGQEYRIAVLFRILIAGAVGMTTLLALLPAAGHDQIWFLMMARRWLGGAELYGPQAFDSNPPAIIWLSAAPVALEHWTHFPATLWGKLLVLLLVSGCVLLSSRFLKIVWRKPKRWEILAILFAAIVLFGAVPARDFGQRDHLVGFLLLPYVLAAGISARSGGLSTRIATGLLAAVAICLKPHHALVPLVLEAAVLVFPGLCAVAPSMPTHVSFAARLRRLIRPETLLILSGALLYLFAIHRTAPLYLNEAVPLTRQVYAAIGHLTLPQLLWEAIELCVLSLLALWLFIRHKGSSLAVRLLLLAGCASLAAYLFQGTGWYYQQLPAIGFFGFALMLELLDSAVDRELSIPAWLPRWALVLIALALGLTTHFTGYPFTQDRAFDIKTPDPSLFRDLPAGTPVAILTTSVDEAMMPVERYHLTWAQRTNNLWLLPEVLRAERPEGQPVRHAPVGLRLEALDAMEHRWMIEDLDRWQPQMVLVERCQDEAVRCQVLEDRHDDLLAWFERDPAFVALWRQRYAFERQDGRFNLYRRRVSLHAALLTR